MTFLLSLFREDIVRALLWTLMHSLWQGLALAIVTGLAILFTRRSSPVRRYNILVGALCLFVAGAGATFFLLLGTPAAAGPGVSGNLAAFNPGDAVGTTVTGLLYTGNEPFWGARLAAYFDERAKIIVAVWLVILAIRLMKLLADLWAVRRIRYYRTSIPSAYWRERVMELAQRIGIKRAVSILESSFVKAPMMAGVLKPVILTPLGLLAQLPPQEVEAILLHELAHIRRKDYLANLLQCFVEVIFFFNPAVMWVSSLIREERENCCDDIAVGETNSKKDLINALISFQEYRQSRYTLAFAGAKDHLLKRVRRIVQRDDKTLDKREKFFLLACLFITAGLTLAYTRQAPVPIKTSKVQAPWQAPAVEDLKPAETDEPSKMQPPVDAMKVMEDTTKKPVSAGDPAALKSDAEWEQVMRKREKARTELELRRLKLDQERARQQAILDEKQRELQARFEEESRKLQMEQLNLKLEALNSNTDTLTGPIREYLDKIRLDQVRVERRNHENVELLARRQRLLRDNELRMEGLARLQTQRSIGMERRLFDTQQKGFLSSGAGRRLFESRDGVIKPILRMLLDKQIVTQTEDLSFSLNNDEFIVNDKKQPKEVFEAFRNEFIHHPGDYINYSKHKGAESTSIRTDKGSSTELEKKPAATD